MHVLNRVKFLKNLNENTNLILKSSQLDILLTLIFLLWSLAIVSFFYISYIGASLSDYLVFKVDDGWCTLPNEGIARHCFGDFGLPFHWDNPYATIDVGAVTSPITYVYFSFLRLFEYQTALFIYLSSMAIGFVVMMLHATKSLNLMYKVAVTLFGGIFSVGFLSAIDRGNHVAFMAPLLYFLIVSKSANIRILVLTLLITLKFWGIFFALIPLMLRRYKEAFLSMLLSIVISLVAMIILTENFLTETTNLFFSLISREIAQGVTPYLISQIGFMRRVSCFIGSGSWCSFLPYQDEMFLTSILVFVFLTFLAAISIRKSEWSLQARYMPMIMLVVLGLPESNQYVLVLISVLTAVIARNEFVENHGLESNMLSRAILVSVALTTVPVGFAFLDPTYSSLHRWQYFVTPLSLNVLLVLFVHEIFSSSLFSPSKFRNKVLN